MIPIKRPRKPAPLARRAASETRRLIDAFQADPEKYHRGELRFEFKKDLYGHREVKTALVKAQHEKCAFCESRVVAVASGDVEHFRPKGGYTQSAEDELKHPGYFWLAYEWKNLLFSCEICNRIHKGNTFPLKDEGRRATRPEHDLGAEGPLLIDPATQDPNAFLGFRGEVAFAVDGSDEGRTTIEVLGLNRDDLLESRAGVLRTLKLLARARDRLLARGDDLDARDRADLEALEEGLRSAEAAPAEYAAMARALLRRG